MGAHPYYYFTGYREDVNDALQALRKAEFAAGRYDPAMQAYDDSYMFEFQFPPDIDSVAPGAQHSSIEEAFEASDASGTGSILDIQEVSANPQFLRSSPLSSEWLIRLFGTDKPTHELVKRVICDEEPLDGSDDLWDELTIGRGESRHLVVYTDGKPSEIFFMGYSVD